MDDVTSSLDEGWMYGIERVGNFIRAETTFQNFHSEVRYHHYSRTVI
jgi:hypothetical protein